MGRELQDTRTIKDFETGYSTIIMDGLILSRRICEDNNISYDFIGKVDADMLLSCNYFEALLAKFQYNPRLGVAGGCAPGQTVRSNPMPGGAYLLRRECLEQLGNLDVEYDIDAVISIKARLRGWEARIFDDAHFVHKEQRSLWSARRHGFKAYVLRKPPLALVWYLAQPFLTGRLQEIPAFLYGYMSALFGREKRVTDRDVKDYYSHVYSKELVKTISERIKRRFARNPKLSAPGSG
ncbi:glycosyltransferase [Chloroflexota bacterium]